MGDFKTLLDQIKAGQDLDESQAESAITQIMSGKTGEEEIKTFLLSLKEKGEKLSEVVGAARAMRAHAARIETAGVPVDTCGTGGDGLKTVNISTLAALVAAGAGVPVAKHGNRAISSACGSADLLEALGVQIDLEPASAQRCLAETGFAFLFAPRFHPAMKAVAPVRKALGVPTIFNLLGPLTNPAQVRHQVVGVADPKKMKLYAEALKELGAERILVVHGADGQDELSTTGPTQVVEFNRQRDPERFAEYELVPETFGFQKAALGALQGASAQENAVVAKAVLGGETGAVRDAVLLNAAAALYVVGAAGDLAAGISLAASALDQGKAESLLERVATLTQTAQAQG